MTGYDRCVFIRTFPLINCPNVVFCLSGANDKAIIDVIGNRSNQQRQVIKEAYKDQYHKVYRALSTIVW